MRRVLIISTVGLIYDGITSVVTSYLEAMDLTSLDIRLVGTIKIEPTIKVKIESMGCSVVELPDRRRETLKYFFALLKYIRKEKIEVIHAHGNSGTLSIEMLAGWIGGAKKRIAHSHNTKCDQVKADKLLRPLFNCLYTDALACGKKAGIWLFGNKPFTVLPNGRDVNKYKFNPVKREELRKKYGLNGELVIGHVGGFFEQKNHFFLIQIFREVLKTRSNAKLFLIGDGPLKESIEKSADDIRTSVKFLGTTDHVEDYLNMMDVMVLPSLFEGLPLVVIEWQINGLPCLISDIVTEECNITNTTCFFSLTDSPEKWSKQLCSMITSSNRLELADAGYRLAKESEFNIVSSANHLRTIYEE